LIKLIEHIRKYYPPGIDLLTFSLMLGMFIYVLVFYGDLPAEIPNHFNAAGEADAYGEKSTLLGLMLLHLLLVLTIFIANYFLVVRAERAGLDVQFNRNKKYTQAQMESLKMNVSRMLATTNLAITVMFSVLYYTMVQSGLGNEASLGFGFNFTVVLIFVPLFYYLRKIYHELKK